MIKIFYKILLLLILLNSCDKQSNPFVGDDPVINIENMQGESRDILIIENFDIECSMFNQNECQLNNWCEYQNGDCISVPRDILIVANQYNEGLIVYDIDNDNTIQLNEIYSNNSFEVLDNISLENDLELRKLVYSSDTQFLYVLDKFEYVYSVWLPGLLDQYTCPGNQTLNPYQLNPYDGVSNYHTTQVVVDHSNINNLDEALLLFKYNANNISEQNLEGLASTTTSCSKLGVSYLDSDMVNLFDASCNSELISGITDFDPYASPLFDYNISDIYFDNGKIYIANPYDSFVFKNSNGEKLNINYHLETSGLADGCNLPENSISFTESGDILYNIEEEVGYFEFNFHGLNLMDLYSQDCIPGPNNYFFKCLTGSENMIFGGDVNSKFFEIMISGNKLIGNLLGDFIDTENNCGLLLSLDVPENNTIGLFYDDKYSVSVYDFYENNLIEFDHDFVTNSKVKSIYVHNGYIVTGMVDDGCYITLLEPSGHTIDDIPIFGSGNFTVNDIFYDEDNNLLLLSCGSKGVLVYSWDGNGTNVTFLNHIVSSHAYSAKVYKNSYIIIATKYGVEIYNYEIN